MALNREQQQVVDTIDRNVLLLASAGMGKTNTLAMRVAQLLQKGRAQGPDILCVTFTNKASREMKARIIQEAGSAGQAVEVATFHSFCFSLLQLEAKRRGAGENLRTIIDEEDVRNLLTNMLSPGDGESTDVRPYELVAQVYDHVVRTRERGRKGSLAVYYFMSDVMALIGKMKEVRALHRWRTDNVVADYAKAYRAVDLSALSNFCNGSKAFREDPSFAMNVARFVAAYDERLAEARLWDFTDLVDNAHDLLANDRECRSRWADKYGYIAIDEVQDTSVLEYECLSYVWTKANTLICGDFFQTIYEWRGSEPQEILRRYRAERDPVTIIFHQNYRSAQKLFEGCQGVLEHLFPREVAEVYKERPRSMVLEDGDPIGIYGFEDEEKQADWMFDRVCGFSDESTAILVRTNNEALKVSKYMKARKTAHPECSCPEFLLVDDYTFYRRKEIKDILAFFKILQNPNDKRSAIRLCKTYIKGVGDRTIQDINGAATSCGLYITDFLTTNIYKEEPYEALFRALDRDSVIVYDVESTGVSTVDDEIIQIAAIRIDKTGRMIEKFERFIRPQKSVGSSVDVHHFDDEYLEKVGEPAEQVLRDFLDFVKGRVIVGHNVSFDLSILATELGRHGLGKPQHVAVYDTLSIFRRLYPNEENHKLEHLSHVFETLHKPTHNAFHDILATGELLVYAVDTVLRRTVDERRALIMRHRDKFSSMAAFLDRWRSAIDTTAPKDYLASIMKDMAIGQVYVDKDEMARAQGVANLDEFDPFLAGPAGKDKSSHKEQLERLRTFYKILRAMEDEVSGLTGQSFTGMPAIQRVLQDVALDGKGEDPRLRLGQNVPIITVHQAKGSEFDHVIMPSVNSGMYPLSRSENEDEERRVFYVAITRAKKTLDLCYYEYGPSYYGGHGRNGGASPYLEGFPASAVKRY